MTKGTKALLTFLIAITTIFAGTTGYFYAKSNNLKAPSITKNDEEKASTPAVSAATTAKESPATSAPSAASVTATASGNKPSNPTDTVTVAQGETLLVIGQKAGVSWTVLADVNGIDANKIQAGQVIVVPKNNQVTFTVNNDKVATLQKNADAGKDTFRLSPLETAKADAPSLWGIVTTDAFTEGKADYNLGTADVSVVHNNKTYLISLIQPGKKGATGLWAISLIKPGS